MKKKPADRMPRAVTANSEALAFAEYPGPDIAGSGAFDGAKLASNQACSSLD